MKKVKKVKVELPDESQKYDLGMTCWNCLRTFVLTAKEQKQFGGDANQMMYCKRCR